MGGKPIKKRPCTKKCPADCKSNYNNHIPHEHLIVASSTLVIVLAGIILTSLPSAAAPRPIIRKPVVTVTCADTDFGKVPEKKGAAMLIETNKTTNLVTRKTLKEDFCYTKRLVQEFSCGRNNKTIITARMYCKKNESCSQGACVPLNATTTTLKAPDFITNTPQTEAPSSTAAALNGPAGYCVLAGISGADFTHLNNLGVGRGYAQIYKSKLTDFKKLAISCTERDFRTMEADYCKLPNQSSFQKMAVTYDAKGNFLQFGGCHAIFGCEYHSCPATQNLSSSSTPATDNSARTTCLETDGGNNPDVPGTATMPGQAAVRDFCSDSETLVERHCATNGDTYFVTSTITDCESGVCSNGACITETSD